MSDPFTHEVKFDLESGQFWRGEAEFNTDGKVSVKPDEWSIPFSGDNLKYFYDLLKFCNKIYEENGGIKKIVIKKKEEA